MGRTFFITTLGCPKNVADSRQMHRSLLREGYEPADSPYTADYHLINSCSFIESAREETIQTVLEGADIKKEHTGQKLVLVGCFAQRYETAVREELPEVDLSFGTGLYHRTGEILTEKFGAPALHNPLEPSVFSGMEYGGEPYAPVKLSEGCDRKCAFCAIPSFRGSFRSRDENEILEEIRELTASGVREAYLVSQDTNAFGGNPQKILDLIARMHEIPDLHWIRILYMYPDARTRRFLEGWDPQALPKLVPYLESPVQHASARVLKAMNRAGNREQFAELFALAREKVPGLEIRTSLLLGFPGETAADIDEVHAFLDECKPEKLALFAYSPEEGTSGFSLSGMPDENSTADMINEVRDHHLSLLKDIHLARENQVYECMVDEISPDGMVVRRKQDAPEVDEVIHIDAAEAGVLPNWSELVPGDLVSARVTGFFEYDMSGELLGLATPTGRGGSVGDAATVTGGSHSGSEEASR
ncbi:MAG: 30S ribosomal protein S12 methylthiotransferase RimO [Spirochaetaceae bacterium]|nr:30S ribosomal protein S12 methylthiotransferase RimO [Spirochaetaceae bacterium]|tara:strand:- start:24354 stop:25775 length:1422 start_codon:yes stop_codon:yes gene_type:complete